MLPRYMRSKAMASAAGARKAEQNLVFGSPQRLSIRPCSSMTGRFSPSLHTQKLGV